jgi:hypothetical protein
VHVPTTYILIFGCSAPFGGLGGEIIVPSLVSLVESLLAPYSCGEVLRRRKVHVFLEGRY